MKTKIALFLMLVVGAVTFGVWKTRTATAEPKPETFSELDVALFRADVAEINAVKNDCAVRMLPTQLHAQTLLDKYKLKLDDLGRTWGLDINTREVQHAKAGPVLTGLAGPALGEEKKAAAGVAASPKTNVK